jgi:N-acetylglucosaminyl-diphospho-decaprenol L-rhamnosyltransferase
VTTLAVVVVTHDTCDEVLGCLDTIDHADEVVVVDAGSSDGTPGAVRARHPGVRVLELANTGFGRGVNAGVRACTAGIVVAANADVRFDPGAIARLARVLAGDAGLGAAGPAVRDLSGAPQASARQIPGTATALGHALLGQIMPANPWTARYYERDADPGLARDVDWLSGCAIALRRHAFEQVGGFDPGYFLYVEDVDLGWRLRRAGWRLRYEPDATVTHRGGASTGRRRVRALIAHAHSLDRFYGRTRASAAARLLRPVVRVGLAGWVGIGIVAGAARRASR